MTRKGAGVHYEVGCFREDWGGDRGRWEYGRASGDCGGKTVAGAKRVVHRLRRRAPRCFGWCCRRQRCPKAERGRGRIASLRCLKCAGLTDGRTDWDRQCITVCVLASRCFNLPTPPPPPPPPSPLPSQRDRSPPPQALRICPPTFSSTRTRHRGFAAVPPPERRDLPSNHGFGRCIPAPTRPPSTPVTLLSGLTDRFS